MEKQRRKFRLSIKTKFVILILIIALIPLMMAVYIGYDSSKKIIQEESAYYLYGISDNRINQIENYLLDKKKSAATLARVPSIIEATENFNNFLNQGVNSFAYLKTERESRPILTYFKESSDYDDFFILSPENILLFSVNNSLQVGKNFSETFFEKKQNIDTKEKEELNKLLKQSKTLLQIEISPFRYYPEEKKLLSFIIVPVIQEGKFIGSAVFRINHKGIYSIIQNYTGLGKTGENVLAIRENNQALFIAPLRNDPEAAFEKSIELEAKNGLAVQKSLQGGKGWGVVKDYRGKEVLAAWRYLPSLKWGLVVKMDLSEILVASNDLRNRLFFISAILLIMILLITVLMVKSITDPIKKLTKITSEISKGKLSYRAEINSGDEIEDLSNSFNKMTENLLKTQSKLSENLENLEEEKARVIQEKEKLDAILYSIGDGVFVIDNKNKINIFNPEAELISNFSAKEIIGKEYNLVLNFVSEKINVEENDKFIQEAIKQNEVINIKRDTVLIRKDNKKIPVSGSAAPLLAALLFYMILLKKEKLTGQNQNLFLLLLIN